MGKFCLVGCLRVGPVGQPEIFIFSILPTPPDQIYPSTPPIQFIATPPPIQIIWPPPLQLKLLHLIFSQSESDKPILSNPAVTVLWPADIACAKWRKMVTWLTKDCWTVYLSTDSSKTMSLHNKAKIPDGFAVSFHFAMIIGCYPEANRKYNFFSCPSQLIFFFFKRIQRFFGWEINSSHVKCFIMSMISFYFVRKLTSQTPSFTLHSMLWCVYLSQLLSLQNLVTRWRTWWRHEIKMAAPIAVKTWMEFESLLLRSLYYTDAKMCLFGEELNNAELGNNKHMINVWNLLGWVLGRVKNGQLTDERLLGRSSEHGQPKNHCLYIIK